MMLLVIKEDKGFINTHADIVYLFFISLMTVTYTLCNFTTQATSSYMPCHHSLCYSWSLTEFVLLSCLVLFVCHYWTCLTSMTTTFNIIELRFNPRSVHCISNHHMIFKDNKFEFPTLHLKFISYNSLYSYNE